MQWAGKHKHLVCISIVQVILILADNQATSLDTDAVKSAATSAIHATSTTSAATFNKSILPSMPSAAVVDDSSKKWAKQRRRPTGLLHVRNDAAAKISDVASTQKSYYQAKLDMAREKHASELSMAQEKHAAEMLVLSLQQQLLKKQLSEVIEQ
jgi:hypothetical protein